MKKATKIIGAVLGVLLVAALFTGAAAAADNEYNLGDVYVYHIYNGFPFEGTTWTMGDESVKFLYDSEKEGYYIGGNNITEGTYSYTEGFITYKINVKYSGAAPDGTVNTETATGLTPIAVLGGDVNSKFIIAVNSDEDSVFIWTNPDGSLKTLDPTVFGMKQYFDADQLADFFEEAEELDATAEYARLAAHGAGLIALAVDVDTIVDAESYAEVLAIAEEALDAVKEEYGEYIPGSSVYTPEYAGAKAVVDALNEIPVDVDEETAFANAKQAAVNMVAWFEDDESQANDLFGLIYNTWMDESVDPVVVDLPGLFADYQQVLTADLKKWIGANPSTGAGNVIAAFTDTASLSVAKQEMKNEAVDVANITDSSKVSQGAAHVAGNILNLPATVMPNNVLDSINQTITAISAAGFTEADLAGAKAVEQAFLDYLGVTSTTVPASWPAGKTLGKAQIVCVDAAIAQYGTTDKTKADVQIRKAVEIVGQLQTITDVMQKSIDHIISVRKLDPINDGVIAVRDAILTTPAVDSDEGTVGVAVNNGDDAAFACTMSLMGASIVKDAVFSSAVTSSEEAAAAALLAAHNVSEDPGFIDISPTARTIATLAAYETADAVVAAASEKTGPLAYALKATAIAAVYVGTAAEALEAADEAWTEYYTAENTFELTDVDDLGTYTVQSVVTRDDPHYSSLAPAYMLGNPTSFNIVKGDTSRSLTALSDEVVQGGFVTVELTAPYNINPGYLIGVENGIIPEGQAGVAPAYYATELSGLDCAWVNVELAGSADFVVKATTTDNVKVKLFKFEGKDYLLEKPLLDKTLTIKVVAGKITADAASAAVYIGNEAEISGTNDLGKALTLFIKGTNYDFRAIPEDAITKSPVGKVWDAKINTAALTEDGKKRPDAGNYTIYVARLTANVVPNDQTPVGEQKRVSELTASDLDNSKYCDAYTTVVLALKQPFISITEAPAVVVKGEHLVVKGTAEGQPEAIKAYIFGTNFFKTADATVDEDGVFELDLKVDPEDNKWQAGQYFAVFQHPMYDTVFNVGPKQVDPFDISKGYNIVKNENGSYIDGTKVIFNTNDRQSANAAQALCDALDDENIDDMYVKASFFVAGPSSVIGAIPEQIIKGEKLTVSGVAIGHKNEAVSVELLSTAFAAVPKATVGSASFVSATTRVGDDGLWSVTFDTSDLNADDYTLSVAVGQLDPATHKIKIVEGTVPKPTTEPTTQPTTQPTAQPTQTPASPGFGILAALAGLGAVAVLLLRRQ